MPEEMAPILNIVGDKVALGPRRREHLPLYLKWVNDFEVTRTLEAIALQPITLDEEVKWFESTQGQSEGVYFTVYDRSGLRPIGTASLRDVDHFHRRALFGIMIGEREYWGRGLGTEATAMTLDYGFNALGLHNIMLNVFDYNERGIRAYRRAGFREIGRRREAHRLGGEAHDVIMMDCLASEFKSLWLNNLTRK